jgi:hypothetical protein
LNSVPHPDNQRNIFTAFIICAPNGQFTLFAQGGHKILCRSISRGIHHADLNWRTCYMVDWHDWYMGVSVLVGLDEAVFGCTRWIWYQYSGVCLLGIPLLHLELRTPLRPAHHPGNRASRPERAVVTLKSHGEMAQLLDLAGLPH